MRISGESAVGGGLIEVGDYVFAVTECEAVTAKSTGNEGFQLAVEIIDGSVAGQEGKELKFQNFYGAKLFKLAAALCLTNNVTGKPFTPSDHDKLLDDIKNKRPVGEFDFEPQEALNRQFCCDVVLGQEKKEGKNAGKRFPELGFNVRPVEAVAASESAADAAFN